jgi:peptidoglycan hydrolase CwlO-like protein
MVSEGESHRHARMRVAGSNPTYRPESTAPQLALLKKNRQEYSSIVTGVEKCRTTEPGLRRRSRRLAHDGVRMLALGLAAAITLTMIVSSGPVAGDQVSDLKAQAAQIARDLVLEQLQIGAYQQKYDVDGAKVTRDETMIDSTEHQISADIGRVGRDRKRLEGEALSAYINLDPESEGTQVLFEGSQSDAFARAEYEDVTTGDANLTIDVLHTDENGLNTQRAMLEQQEAQDQATTNQQAAQASAARQTQVELNSKQSEITGQLAVAVAQQQAAQAAAAAKAVQAAQAAAAAASPSPRSPTGSRSATSTTQPASSTATQGTTPGASSGDPSLPPFLQCVLRVESGGNYNAVSPGGAYMGGFQFSQPTWNEAAQLAGMPQLANVPPNDATPAEQDDLAIALYDADGQQPWDDSCRNG